MKLTYTINHDVWYQFHFCTIISIEIYRGVSSPFFLTYCAYIHKYMYIMWFESIKYFYWSDWNVLFIFNNNDFPFQYVKILQFLPTICMQNVILNAMMLASKHLNDSILVKKIFPLIQIYYFIIFVCFALTLNIIRIF